MNNPGWLSIIIDANAASKVEHAKLKSAYKLAVKSTGLRFRKDSYCIEPEPAIKFTSARRYENRLILAARIDDTQFELIDLETTLESIYEQILAELNAVADVLNVSIEVRKLIYGKGRLKVREQRVTDTWGRL